MPARPGKTSAKRPKGAVDPSQPLRLSQREVFAQFVANGVPVPEAYRRAGYSGGDDARWDLRRAADVDLRVNWLLGERIRADAIARQRSEKEIVDARLRLVREFERIAYSSLGDVVAWDRKAIIDLDGSVQGFTDELVATPSHKLSRDAMAAVKSVKTKAGKIQIDMHDKLNAMNALAKVLGMVQDVAPLPSSVTVNQVNVGDVPALEVARRVAFMLASAGQAMTPQVGRGGSVTVDATATEAPGETSR